MKNKNGITLVALVVTIIVLLILAGVTVSMVVGQNGVITKANEAKVKQDASTVLEQLQIKILDIEANEIISGSYEDKIERLKAEGYLESDNRVNMLNLLGMTISTGNGTGNKDVYKVEKTNQGYQLMYYDKNQVASTINTIFRIIYTAEEYFDFDEATGTISLKNSDSYYDYNDESYAIFTNEIAPLKKYKIPPTYQGKKVEKIGRFKAKGIEMIEIPEGITELSMWHFSWMPDLKTVVLPNTIMEIPYRAFERCTKLENITMPNIKGIDNAAFENCTSLKSIIIPSSVTTIGYGVFDKCTNLQNIYCRAPSQPASWNSNWSTGITATITWGYTGN